MPDKPPNYDRVIEMQRVAKVRWSTWELDTPWGDFRVSFSYQKDLAQRRIVVKRLNGDILGRGAFGGVRNYGVSNTSQRPCKNMAFVAINWFLNDEAKRQREKV